MNKVSPVSSSDKTYNISVIDNRLVFETIKDYEKIVDNPSQDTKQAFLTKVNSFTNFTSLQINLPNLQFLIYV